MYTPSDTLFVIGVLQSSSDRPKWNDLRIDEVALAAWKHSQANKRCGAPRIYSDIKLAHQFRKEKQRRLVKKQGFGFSASENPRKRFPGGLRPELVVRELFAQILYVHHFHHLTEPDVTRLMAPSPMGHRSRTSGYACPRATPEPTRYRWKDWSRD